MPAANQPCTSTPHIPTSNPAQNFQQYERALEPTPDNSNKHALQHGTYADVMEAALGLITSRNKGKFVEIVKQFTGYLSEKRQIFIHYEYLLDCFEDIKFMVCKNNKLYTYGKGGGKGGDKGSELKGYVIVGKAVSVHKRKKKQQQEMENKEQRDELSTLIEQGMLKLIEDNKVPRTKQERNYTVNDLLLRHQMPDQMLDQVYIVNDVHCNFVPLEKTIVMLLPSKNEKPDCLSFVRGSILHGLVDEINLISKVMTKELIYKNTVLKGLFFVEEGEVQVKSGRVIARGWTTCGHCKVSGIAWKFKPVPFIRFLIRNSSVWKQFFNDIELNSEYPFNIVHILGLSDEQDFTQSVEWKSLGRKKIAGRSARLPRLPVGARSVDYGKIQEIQRLRHYDQRINDIFIYKQDLLAKKLKGLVHGKFQPIFRDERSQQKLQRKKKQMMIRLNSKNSQILRKQAPNQTQAGENILIISVLKRLESIADLSEDTTTRKKNSLSSDMQVRNFFSDRNTKRENSKLLPMQMHQHTKHTRRYHKL